MRAKILRGVVAGVLGLSVTGTAALANFQAPNTASVASVIAGTPAATQSDEDKRGPGDKIKDVLDKLVANGTITQAQEDAIVKAFREAAGRDRDDHKVAKMVFGDLMKLSAEYLGLPKGQLEKQLKDGMSLGQIANATSGKSRQGLIDWLKAQVTTQIDQALANGKITQAQADKLKKDLGDRLAKFVDHKFEKRTAAPRTAKSPKPSPSPKA